MRAIACSVLLVACGPKTPGVATSNGSKITAQRPASAISYGADLPSVMSNGDWLYIEEDTVIAPGVDRIRRVQSIDGTTVGDTLPQQAHESNPINHLLPNGAVVGIELARLQERQAFTQVVVRERVGTVRFQRAVPGGPADERRWTQGARAGAPIVDASTDGTRIVVYHRQHMELLNGEGELLWAVQDLPRLRMVRIHPEAARISVVQRNGIPREISIVDGTMLPEPKTPPTAHGSRRSWWIGEDFIVARPIAEVVGSRGLAKWDPEAGMTVCATAVMPLSIVTHGADTFLYDIDGKVHRWNGCERPADLVATLPLMERSRSLAALVSTPSGLLAMLDDGKIHAVTDDWQINDVPGHSGKCNAMALNADGSTLAMACGIAIDVYDVGTQTGTLFPIESFADRLAFADDGHTLHVVGRRSPLPDLMIDTQTGTVVDRPDDIQRPAPVEPPLQTVDILSSSYDGTRNRHLVAALVHPDGRAFALAPHRTPAFSDNGEWVALRSSQQVDVYRTEALPLVAQPTVEVTGLASFPERPETDFGERITWMEDRVAACVSAATLRGNAFSGDVSINYASNPPVVTLVPESADAQRCIANAADRGRTPQGYTFDLTVTTSTP